jgi:hypothetical protein
MAEEDIGYCEKRFPTQREIDDFKRLFRGMLDFEGFEEYIQQQKELSKARRNKRNQM